ncbi:ABC transporter substrate-binding protein [Cohnella caldifontis]|uniref:ABC transporter substrate-binding protein n=1 Tax=Cohnella caldifontis TaxID=3027471 RepID=UPI0023EAF34C|nr:ABC transporter substrate-binding protein [Cohnella sp. YIM B05605]
MSRNASFSKKWITVLAVISLLAAAILAGCSKDNGEKTPAASSGASQPADSGKDASPGSPKTGGVLKIAMTGAPVNLGLVPKSRTVQEVLMAVPALETLGRYDEKGNIVPWLAESWETDPDAKTITYKLKQGVKFHDGTDFNAEAVKFNLDLMIEAKRQEFKDLASVDVVDASTVKLNLSQWNSSMVESVANFLWIMSPTAYQQMGQDGISKHPVGTGPFEFVSFQQDVSVKYKKFAGYWQQGKPYLDGIEWSVIADPLTASATFQNKDVDAFLNVPADIAKQLTGSGNVIKLQSGLGARAGGLITDSANPNSPFADVRVRQALGYAIDRQELVTSILGGFALVTNQWGTQTSWSYNPDVEGLKYDPEKAKQLLKDAGYPNGFKTTIYSIGQDQMVTAMQGYLARVGIDAKIEVLDTAKFQEMTGAKGKWDGIMPYNFRGDADLALYMPRNFGVGGPLYANNILHPDDVTQLLEQAKTAKDQETKKQISLELQKKVFDEYALAYAMYVDTAPAALQSYVKDSGINQTYMTVFTPENAWLDK